MSGLPGRFWRGFQLVFSSDALLRAGLRERYRQTLVRFRIVRRKKGLEPSVAAAREFVELTRLEQAPSPARLQEWKDALNWYFRRGREAGAPR